MNEEEILQLIRKELLEVFKEANNLSRQGSSGFGTSVTDMSSGHGTPTEYLVQAIQKRQQDSKP